MVGVIICISILLGIIPSLSAVVEVTSDDNRFNGVNNDTSISKSSLDSPHLSVDYTLINLTDTRYSNYTYSSCYVDLESNLGLFTRVLKSVLDVIYTVAIIVITVLYVLIYNEIYTRRKKREDRKRELLMTSIRLGGSVKDQINEKGKCPINILFKLKRKREFYKIRYY